MKFLHTGDLHIGKVLHEMSLLEDQKYILKEIVTIAEEEKVDAVIIAGDVYDRNKVYFRPARSRLGGASCSVADFLEWCGLSKDEL